MRERATGIRELRADGLADGLRIRWSERDGWQLSNPRREVTFRIVEA
jgi:hypothetical protein